MLRPDVTLQVGRISKILVALITTELYLRRGVRGRGGGKGGGIGEVGGDGG